MSKPLDIKGRLALSLDMNAAIKEITDQIDIEYKALIGLRPLLESAEREKAEPLYTFLDFHLFVLLLNADIITLFQQFLGTSQPYVKKYCASKLYTTYQEGFKQLYGFYDSSGNLKPSKTRWKQLKTFIDKLPQSFQDDYVEISSSLDAASKSLAIKEWKAIRDAEDHIDAGSIVEFRRSVDDENKVIKDAEILIECLKKVSHYCTVIYVLLFNKTS